ncbi:hypothetical protein [Kitasatospora paranensis]|uniref:Secreted protein n=1 Tax=Kitasatospora paranensis TaxID=258053 RepID=A0ABW2FPP0_9ACTN
MTTPSGPAERHPLRRALTGPAAQACAILASAAALTAGAAACSSSEKTVGGISPAVVSAASEASVRAASAAAEASELGGEQASAAASGAASLLSEAASARAASASAAASSVQSRAAAFESSVSAQISMARASASTALAGATGTGNALSDVTLTGVPTTATDGYPAAILTITNSTSTAANYAVQVDFSDSSGATVETVVVGTADVAPGERRTVLAHGDKQVQSNSAKVVRAQRY